VKRAKMKRKIPNVDVTSVTLLITSVANHSSEQHKS